MTNSKTPAGDDNYPKELDQKQIGIKLSVIIPTLNAGSTLNQTIESLSSARQRGVEIEIIVVDAGSTDDTEQLALEADAKFVTSDRGRGTQLHRGAQLASGDWFLFLHADTVLTSGWDASFVVFTSHPSNAERGGVFTFALDTNDIKARLIEKAVRFRNNWLGLPYGDQGLIINKHFYNCLGGYRKWPIMEDVDLVRRIGMSRMVLFDVKARTSAKRYTEEGYIRRIARNFICLSLYFLKLPPDKIYKIYEKPAP